MRRWLQGKLTLGYHRSLTFRPTQFCPTTPAGHRTETAADVQAGSSSRTFNLIISSLAFDLTPGIQRHAHPGRSREVHTANQTSTGIDRQPPPSSMLPSSMRYRPASRRQAEVL